MFFRSLESRDQLGHCTEADTETRFEGHKNLFENLKWNSFMTFFQNQSEILTLSSLVATGHTHFLQRIIKKWSLKDTSTL